jgi:formamidopyrimidine-DNA glycosylase
MPELPEVEQVRRSLLPHIEGRKILKTEVFLNRLIQYPSVPKFIVGTEGKTIKTINRRGKYLRLELGKGNFILAHLRMTGALIAQPKDKGTPAYAKLKFTLSGGMNLWFTDIRTFGTMYLLSEDGDYHVSGYETLGPEPLSEGFSDAYLWPLAQKSRKPIKTFILDQTVIAGLGNIYADECLATAKILPTKPAKNLSRQEIKALCKAINKVIAQGIANHGTTFRNYQDGDGKKGDNQNHLLVYGRKGKPCKYCGEPLVQIKIGGRGSVYCPHCQK